MKYTFSIILLLVVVIISISLLPPPLTSPIGIVTAQIPINVIKNSCIVNNANIAVQNANSSPLDATNNWWGMPTGATHDGFSAGDAVGQNILFSPHLPAMPFPCDLASADWIPFSEQELQFAITQNIPALRGIGFALLDMQWGYGAKFSLVSKPDYGNLAGEAYIRIAPSPDGAFVTLTIDITRLPTDPTLSQIATCELMPLFLNSIGQVQHKLAPTVSDIDHIVPMESNLMVRFAPNAPEITPEPAPPLVMDYDTSCLPPAIPQPTPTLTPTPISTPPSELEELIEIPPMEGETELLVDTLIENNTPLTQSSIIAGTPDPCEPNESGWCAMLQIGDVFTTDNGYNQITSINHTSNGIVQFQHVLPSNMSYPAYPSWGKVPNVPNHYRLAFACAVADDGTPSNRACYWDTASNTFGYLTTQTNYTSYSSPHISPDASKIAYIATISDGTTFLVDLIIYNFQTPTNPIILSFSTTIYPVQVRWGSSDSLYYSTNSSTTTALWKYNVNLPQSNDNPSKVGLPEEVDFVPNLFDIQDINLFYWSYGDNNNYNLTSFGIDSWTLSFPPITSSYPRYYPFPVYWSPRVGSQANDNQAIMLKPDVNSDWCITSFDVTTIDEGGSVIDIGLCLEPDSYFDWASGIDLSALNNQPPPTPTPTPPPSQFTCLNPDPYAPPADTINLCIQELAQYGIIAYVDGLPTTLPNACANWTLNDGTTQYSQAWTLEELQQVLIGVKDTAKAFYMLKNNLFASSVEAQSLTGASAEEKQIFKTVMDAVPTSEPCNGQIVDVDGFYILRVKNNFKYRNDREYCDFEGWVNGVYVKTENEACTSNSNHAIALYENFYPLGSDFIQYTFVHELGHRFDNQSGISSSNLTTRASQTITDCGPVSDNGSRGVRQVVMGYIIGSSDYHPDNWLRGGRGWGDINTLSNTPTYFQQNTLSITFPGPESRGDDGVERKENQTPEISEAMADMFLNWVYRRITDKVVVLQIDRDATTQTSTVVTDECAPPNIPDQPTLTWATVEQNGDFVWDGFRNIQIPDVHDNRLPGNARYWWMTETMDDIFRDSNWSANQ